MIEWAFGVLLRDWAVGFFVEFSMLECPGACVSSDFCLVPEKTEEQEKKTVSGCCGSAGFVSETRVTYTPESGTLNSSLCMHFLDCQTEPFIPFSQFLIISNTGFFLLILSEASRTRFDPKVCAQQLRTSQQSFPLELVRGLNSTQITLDCLFPTLGSPKNLWVSLFSVGDSSAKLKFIL